MHTFSYICNRYKIQIYIYKLLWFRTGHQSAFRESFDSERDSKRVSRVIWFKTGLQSAFSESFKSERGFKTRFASHLVQNGDSSKRVLRVIWFRTGIQSAFRESFDSKRGFKARFASHLIQNGASKRVSRIIWFKTGFRCWIKWLTKRTLKPRFGFLTVTNLPGTPENSWTRFIYINYYESAPKIEQGTGLNW